MRTIMVVDDKDLSLELIHIFLAREGFSNVKKYDCPLKALSDLKKGLVPDIIITDFRMPEMNGVHFLNSVSLIISKNIPSIIITGDPGSLPPISKEIVVIEKGHVTFFQSLINEVNKVFQTEGKQIRKKIIKVSVKTNSPKKSFSKNQKVLQIS